MNTTSTILALIVLGTLILTGCAENKAGLDTIPAAELNAEPGNTSLSENPDRRQQHPEATGVIVGQVDFTGNPPQNDPHNIAGDSFCEQVHSENPIRKNEIVVNPNATLANVVVSIASGGPDWLYESDGSSRPIQVITQQDCQFFPRVVALQAGQKLAVRNADSTVHNVNAQPRDNPRLNVALFPDKDPVVLSFENPEMAIKLKSDIHPWMVAWVPVFPHSEFAVTGEDGRFELRDLPPGEYVLEAWHEQFGTVQAPVLVFADRPTNVVFNYTNKGSKSGSQVSEDGSITTGTLLQLPEQ